MSLDVLRMYLRCSLDKVLCMGTKSYVYDIRNYSEISNGEEINRHLNNSAN